MTDLEAAAIFRLEAAIFRLEAAIFRLEQAAAVWFNQDLHRDLQALIAAARDSKRATVDVAFEALERRIREIAK